MQITGHSKYDGVMPPHKSVIVGNYEKLDSILVDGKYWYKLQVVPRVRDWIKVQNKNLWYEHVTSNNYKVLDTFYVYETLYTQLILLWT
jgi:hypothetical protein